MAKKPSFVGTLNAIANGERFGHALFEAWAGATRDKALKPTLEMVAVREMEHSWAFAKRLNELGFDVQPAEQAPPKKLLKLMRSDAPDMDKFAAFGIGAPGTSSGGEDNLLRLLADKSIDPQTGALLGRFICEERDSGEALTKAYRAARRRANKGKPSSKGGKPK
ncbi:MAG: hypothetical protein AAF513_17060 [Pseudomonadota bacterium]